MKKKRKNKQMRFDEFYSNGFFELGRMGNIVSLKNNFTEQDILERNTELAQQYDEKKAEIVKDVENAQKDVTDATTDKENADKELADANTTLEESKAQNK